jgi:competence protein ComEC
MCVVMYGYQQPPDVGLGVTQFTFLDLGIGEATLLEQGEKIKILIDTGTEAEFLWRVKPFLASQGIRRLSALVVSHPDADHAGGVESCVKYFHPQQVITAHSEEPTLSRIRDAVHRSGGILQELTLDTTISWSPTLTAQVIWPEVGFESRGEPHEGARPRRLRHPRLLKARSNISTSNDRSLVLRWIYPGGAALFPGDAGRLTEDIWSRFSPCTLLKVAHHGSKRSTGERLLRRVNPQLAIVQPGFFETQRFPHPDTVARIQAASVPLLNTARLGAVRVQNDRRGDLRWECWK